MDASQSPIWFIGDLSDPWIVAIAESIARVRSLRRLDCPGSLPTDLFDRTRPPRLIVIHRYHLGLDDIERLMDWRGPQGANPAPAVFLCVSPYVRYVELERVSRLVDLVVSEATAAEVLPRHVVRLIEGTERRSPRPATPAFRIEVATGNDPLGRTVLEARGAAGYRAEAVDDQEIGGIVRVRNRSAPATERVLTIWEIPLLEPGWAERLNWPCASDRTGRRTRGICRSRDRRPRQSRRSRGLPRTPLRSGRPDRRGRPRGPVDRPGIVARPASGRATPHIAAPFPSSRPSPWPFGGLRAMVRSRTAA